MCSNSPRVLQRIYITKCFCSPDASEVGGQAGSCGLLTPRCKKDKHERLCSPCFLQVSQNRHLRFHGTPPVVDSLQKRRHDGDGRHVLLSAARQCSQQQVQYGITLLIRGLACTCRYMSRMLRISSCHLCRRSPGSLASSSLPLVAGRGEEIPRVSCRSNSSSSASR